LTPHVAARVVEAFRSVGGQRGAIGEVRDVGHDLVDVVPDGFGQAGGVHRDHIRIIDREHVRNGSQQVSLPTEDGGTFREGAGSSHNRIFVVTRERTAMVGAAPLRTVRVRQAAVDSQGGIHGTDGLTGFRRVNGDPFAIRNFFWCVS